MRKIKKIAVAIAAISMLAAITAGCSVVAKDSAETEAAAEETEAGASTETAAEEAPAEDAVSVALILNGSRGDKSFNDLAYNGLMKAVEDFGIEYSLVENNSDSTKYEPSIIEFAEDPDTDVVIVNSADVKEIVERIAPQYPEKDFIIYDSDIDYSVADLSNVYSTTFKQNEASFLAGALAAKMTSISGDDHINPEKVIGYVAGSENVIINDFLLGYVEGCEYADPEARMLISYIGNFSDSAKGKEMCLSQEMQGADVVFQVASGAGLGVLEGCKEAGIYAIGVDDDQYSLFAETDPEQASVIMTSVVKSVDNCVYNCIERYLDGTLPFGETEALGLAEGMVSIAKNENYEAVVPDDIKTFIEETEQGIIDGDIVVNTNIGADISVIEDAKDRIKP